MEEVEESFQREKSQKTVATLLRPFRTRPIRTAVEMMHVEEAVVPLANMLSAVAVALQRALLPLGNMNSSEAAVPMLFR